MTRDELLAGIMAGLTPDPPQAPKDPGPDATPVQKDAYNAAVRDHAVLTTLSKSTGDVSPAERAELVAQVRECLEKGW